MNRELLNSLIKKRLSVSGITEQEEPDLYSQYNEYEPQNLVADWFNQPEWRISKGEIEDKLQDMPEEMGMAGMGTINKVSSMLTPEAKALRNTIQKRNALQNIGEESGKLIKVEGGGLEDIKAAQEELSGLLRSKEIAKNKLEKGDLGRFGFDDYLRAMTDKPVDRWGGDDLSKVFPSDYKKYQDFMKTAAKEGLVDKSSWVAKYQSPEAGKFATSLQAKNRRELDKIYQSAKQAIDDGDQQAYDIYKSVVDDLIRKTNPRNKWDYRLPENPWGAEIIPFEK